MGSNRYWFFIHYLSRRQQNPPIQSSAPDELASIDKIRRVEAALFLTREGLTARKLAKLVGLADATEARTLIRQLNGQYEAQRRSYRVEEVAGGFALLTRPAFASWLRRIGHVPEACRLSTSAMETLAIVAYRQPVLRAEVEAIRGVGCSEVLKQLMETELVKISGRSDDLGRPYLYGTTKRFLQMFGLRSTDRLPRMSWVNEPLMTISDSHSTVSQTETEDSAMSHSFVTSDSQAELLTNIVPAVQHRAESLVVEEREPQASVEEDEEDDFYDEADDDDYDDDEYEDEESEWDDDESEEDDDDDVDDDLEEESEWEEVDDDDDGWVDDDDDDEEDDDDWGDEEEDEDWD